MFLRLNILLFAAVSSAFSVNPTDEPIAADVIKIGAVKTLFRDDDPKKFAANARSFQSVMEAATGLKGKLIAVDSHEELEKQLASGDVQLGAVSALEFGWMRGKQPDLEALMISAADDPDSLKVVVVVGKDSPAKTFADCRGLKLALPTTNRSIVPVYLARLCRQSNASVADFFAESRDFANAEDALEEVVDQRAQVAVTNASALETFQRRKPGRFSRLRVLETSEQFLPSATVYHRDKLDPTIRQKFANGMANAHKTDDGRRLMMLMGVKQFLPTPTDYVQRVNHMLKAYPGPRQTGKNE